jgi:cytochrome c-type biogenesis protein CcmH
MSGVFIAIAALLLLASIAAVILPLWRGAQPARATALWTLVLLLVAAVLLYREWSNWSWETPSTSADNPAAMVARLARRLEANPDDREGWMMLGRSYLVLGQNPLAARAYQRADRLAGGTDAQAIEGWAQALFQENESEIDGRAGRLFERALELDPNSASALLFSAVAAQRRGDLAVARTRLGRVLESSPPENLRQAIEQQVAVLDAQLAGMPPAVAGAGPLAPAAKGADAGSSAGVAVIRVNVTLGVPVPTERLAGAPLFVLARRPGESGPPLAVKRLSATLPQRVELTPADAMLAGLSIAAGDQLEVVARISLSGAPSATAGDPFGIVRYHVGKDHSMNLVIDAITR